ncbi:MAG: hypothetical protein IJC39_04165 [Firmicutes bacterium]|nr:hypothetical protein [Bacillota bacterium]
MKKFVMGLIVGAACMMAIPAIGAATNVTAVIPGNVTFKVNGENKPADPYMPVLNYDDRVYVPVRYMAELAGWNVDWDPVMRQVVLNVPEVEPEVVEKVVEVEKIVYVDASENPDASKVYQKLPISYSDSEMSLKLTGITRYTSGPYTRVYIELENKGDKVLQLPPTEAVLEVDGEEYEMYVNSNFWDSQWFGDIQSDETISGYLLFPLIEEEYERGTLSLTVRTNTGTGYDEETFDFNFRRQ